MAMRQMPRLFVDTPLAEGAEVELPDAAGHYLRAVLRLEAGAPLQLFDDRSGEWLAEVGEMSKRRVTARIKTRRRPRETPPDLWLLAAPIRPERFQWLAEKATELGVARFVPVLTERVNHARQNVARLRAHMVEAAEQCGRTALPELAAAAALPELLAHWPAGRALYFADEEGGEAMTALRPAFPAAILIGPEGGFSAAERTRLLAQPMVRRLALGPRVLRADTAAVAAIAQLQLLAAESGWRAALPPAKAGA